MRNVFRGYYKEAVFALEVASRAGPQTPGGGGYTEGGNYERRF